MTHTTTTSRRRLALRGGASVMAALLALSLVSSGADAAYSGDYDPGLLMADAVMYDYASMSQAQIQTFLDGQGADCVDGEMACLKDYQEYAKSMLSPEGLTLTTPVCIPYAGEETESAAEIIYNIARACKVNPKLLLTVLESRVGLLTISEPTSADYENAPGSECDPAVSLACQYGGQSLAAQLYLTAYLFGDGRLHPTDYYYKTGTTVSIATGEPSTGTCPAPKVKIRSTATAVIYSLMSYQASTSAIGSLYDYDWSDECSDYGVRDFWRTYTDMFGPTTKAHAPRRIAQRDWTRDGYADYFSIAADGVLYGYFAKPGSANIGSLKYGRGWKRMLFTTTSYNLLGNKEMDLVAVTLTGDVNVYAIATSGAASAPVTIATGWDRYDTVFGGTGWDHQETGVLFARDAASGELVAFPAVGPRTLGDAVSLGTGWDSYDMLTFAGDLNGDGWNDILARDPADNTLHLLKDGATADFSGVDVTVGSGWGATRTLVGAGDWNADGWLDFLAINNGGQLVRYTGNGAGGVAGSMVVGKGWTRMTVIS